MQKFLVLFGFAFFLIPDTHAQSPISENEKLASLCKVWGFLKYYHPAVASGTRDWDAELMDHFQIIETAQNKEELSKVYLDWITSLGKVNPSEKYFGTLNQNCFLANLDSNWMDHPELFTDSLIIQLKYIRDNRHHGDNFYGAKRITDSKPFGFVNEKKYEHSFVATPAFRLLSLFRYWNIINYYFPYKYLIGEDWTSVLDEMIPAFKAADDTTAFHFALLELVAKTNDSHADLIPFASREIYGFVQPPFAFRIAENKVIVTKILNDSLARRDDIKVGDVYLTINNKSVDQILEHWYKSISASNDAVKLRKLKRYLFSSPSDSVLVKCLRENNIYLKTVHTYHPSDSLIKNPRNQSDKSYKILDQNIGYIDMGSLKMNEVKKAMNSLIDTRGIIFDLRDNAQGTMYQIADYLNSTPKHFVKFSLPDGDYPGVFLMNNSYTCGVINKHCYKGKVVLLVNENTQSHGEFTCMALQTAGHVTVIGSQTAGADGNVITIVFPGGYQTYMTGYGIYYPDGRETQRIGIVPDVEVKPTIKAIREGRDELLENAITVIITSK